MYGILTFLAITVSLLLSAMSKTKQIMHPSPSRPPSSTFIFVLDVVSAVVAYLSVFILLVQTYFLQKSGSTIIPSTLSFVSILLLSTLEAVRAFYAADRINEIFSILDFVLAVLMIMSFFLFRRFYEMVILAYLILQSNKFAFQPQQLNPDDQNLYSMVSTLNVFQYLAAFFVTIE